MAGGKLARYALSKKGTGFKNRVVSFTRKRLERLFNNGERQYKKIVANADYFATRGMRTYAKDAGLNIENP